MARAGLRPNPPQRDPTNPTAHKPSRTLETRCLDAQCTCRTHTAAVVSGIYPKAPPHPNTVGMPLHIHQTSAHTTVEVVHTTTPHYGPVLEARHRHSGLPALSSCCQSSDRRECADSLCQKSGDAAAPRDSMSAHSFRDPATCETRRFMRSRMQYTAAACSTAATGSFMEKPFAAAPTTPRLSHCCRTTTRPALVTSPSCL